MVSLPRDQQGSIPSRDSRRKSVSLPFLASETTWVPWLLAPSSSLTASRTSSSVADSASVNGFLFRLLDQILLSPSLIKTFVIPLGLSRESRISPCPDP